MICSGKTSNFAFTPSRSSTVPLIVLMQVMFGSTSCAMSLSPVEISTLMPRAAALRANGLEQRLDLRPQVVGHRRTLRLVLGKQVVAERLARRVEHHRDALRV